MAMSDFNIQKNLYHAEHPSRYTTLKQRRIDVNATSWRHIDVYKTLFWQYVPADSLNTCTLSLTQTHAFLQCD